jgi:preprotein translocase subunit YajC
MILLQSAGNQGMNPVVLMLIMGVFFFFMIWPQMRRQKKAKNFTASLAKGDHIVTTGGIHGKIAQIQDKHMIIEMEEGKMKIDPTGISMEMTQAAYPSETKTDTK